MKKYILLFACVIATSVVFAQNQVLDDNEAETAKQGVAIPIKGMSGFSAFLYVDLMKLEQSDPTLKSIPPDIVERYGLIEINSEWYVGAFADIKPEKRSWAAEYGVLFNGNTDFHITTVNIPVKNYVSFVNSEIANFIEIGEKNYPMMDSARRVTHASLVNSGYNLSKGYCGKNVVIGIVDIGFDYTHRNFYDSTQTTYRVKRVWNQTVSGNPPSGYNYGTEYTTQSAILAAQYSHNNETHGTHVAGMAAGGGTSESAMRKYKGMAPESDIVLVATTMQSDAIYDGLTYILSYAQSVGKPCVVNMSLGGHTGPHDGQDASERTIDNIFNNREGAALLVSAGNEGNDPLHLSKTFTAQDSTLYTYVVKDNGSTAYSGYVDIWGTPGSNFRVKIAVADSTSSASQLRSMSFPLTIHTNSSQTSWAAAVISTGCTVQYATYTSYYYYNDKPRVFLYISGTSNTGSARSFLIKVESTSGTVHMWSNSGKFNGGTAGTRGNTNYTTNNRASGNTSIMVASYDSKTNWTAYSGAGYYAPSASIGRRSTFSSIGPGLNPTQNKPEIAAPGCEILSSYNKYDGSYSTSSPYITHVQNSGGCWWGIMQGTSMACPAASGIVALWMEAYPQLTYSQIKYLLRTTANTDSYTGTIPSTGSPQWGWGKIDAMAGLRVILQKTAKPTITNSGSNQICPGSTTTLTAPSGYSQYIWNTGETSRSITVSQPGAYYVRAVSAEGFKTPNSDTINIRYGTVLSTSIAEGNQTICQGQSARLVVGTAGQGTTYRWSTGATSQLINVTPNQTTQYWVTTSKMGYCPKTDTITVTVQPYLTTTVTSNQTICRGSSVTLSVSGGTSHSWNTGATGNSITVTPNTTTTYTVTSSQNGYCSRTDNITINVQPYVSTTISRDTTICQGQSVTLTSTGGTSKSWNTGATTNSITVTPSTTTRYTVTSSQNGYCSTTDTVMVTVRSNISTTISRDTTICQGQSVTLTSTGGTSRRWSTNSTSQSITVAPSSSTTYSVTVEQNGYCPKTDVVRVNVKPYVSTTITPDQTICQGSSATLTVSGGTSRTWNTGATGTSITVTPPSTTRYTVTSSQSGKCSTTDTVTVTVQPYVSTTISRDTTICQGHSVTLTSTGGTSRTWSNGATATTITVTPLATTTYTVTSNASNQCSTIDTVTVTVRPYVSTTISRDTTICIGQSVNLAISGGTSHTWNTGATTNSITVSPNTTTTYTVTSNANNQCSTTDTVTVTVRPYVSTTISRDTTICVGETVSLTVNGGTSRTWSNGGTGTSITVTPSTTTTYTVTSNQANQCSTTDTVTVTVQPYVVTSISSDTSICPGEPVSLTVTGGTSRTWSNGNTSSTITVRPITPTTYTVTSSQANQCPTTDTVTISIKPTVTTSVSGNTTICRGTSAILTATGGMSREWSTGETQDTIVVTPSVTTIYVVITDSTGICSNIDSIKVTVNQLPNVTITGDTVITAGNSATLVASGANSYVWSTGATSPSITVSPAATTSYSVEGTDVNGCSNTARTTVVVNAVSIASGSELEFKVYPIPTESKLTVEGESIKTITIYNILGKVIDKIECDGEKTVVLAVKDYAQGVYVISVADTKGQTGRRTFIVR
ncbi:MAG: S8 family peptidase [Bacteroidales bacterium]|nr:S8 family peptidase [Bacteroidales bacterium]